MENWLRTDEREESVSALAMMRDSTAKVVEDVYQWKWVIIAAHNALQGFMVLALRNGNNLTVMPGKLAGKWLEAYRAEKPLPEERLDSFPNLYKKIKSKEMEFLVSSKRFQSLEEHDRAVDNLIDLRNDFIHFVPRGWSIEVSGLPEICLRIIEIIRFLGWESSNVLWHEIELRDRADRLINEIIENLNNVECKYQRSS